MQYDIHTDIGPKARVATYEEVLATVRAAWPGSYAEGSTGTQRSFWIATVRGAELVGHAWEIRSAKGGWWLRCRSPSSSGHGAS